MKVFGFEIRKFETDPTNIKVIETWCVKWSSLHKNCIGSGEQVINVQGFPTKEGANFYAKELRDARSLLGDKDFDVEVYKQEISTNV